VFGFGKEEDEPDEHDEIDWTPDPSDLGSPSEMLRVEEVGESEGGQPGEEEGDGHGETEGHGSQTIRWDFSCRYPSHRTDRVRVCSEVNVDHGNDCAALDLSVSASAGSPDDGDEEQGYTGDRCTRDEHRTTAKDLVKEQTYAGHDDGNALQNN